MTFEDVFRETAYALSRFGAFAAHALLFGFVVIAHLVLRPAYAKLEGDEWKRGRALLSDRLEGYVQASMVLSAVGTAIAILLQALVTADLRRDDLDLSSVTAVLETTFGKWYALRFPLLITLAVLIVSRVRKWTLRGAGDGKKAPSNVWWGVWGALAFMLLVTSTFSGHSTVASPKWVAVVNDLAHLAAGSIWFSGIVLLAVALPEGWRGAGREGRIALLSEVVTRFSKVAMVTIGIVAVTGTLNSFLHVARPADLWEEGYGRALAAKIVLFLGILALGGVNHFFVARRLQRARSEGAADTSARKLFRKTIALELAIGLGVMASTGLLVGLPRTKKSPPSVETPSGVGVDAEEDSADRAQQRTEPQRQRNRS